MPKVCPDDIQVMMPYRQLESLLAAAAETKLLRLEVKRITEQQAALRLQFVELMELFQDLRS